MKILGMLGAILIQIGRVIRAACRDMYEAVCYHVGNAFRNH